MISERTLKRWRREALEEQQLAFETSPTPEALNVSVLQFRELNKRILRLTQDLLDEHLMRRK